MPIPTLERHCSSWVVVNRTTGKPVLETFSRHTAEAINQERYEVVTAFQWLTRFNRLVRPTLKALCWLVWFWFGLV